MQNSTTISYENSLISISDVCKVSTGIWPYALLMIVRSESHISSFRNDHGFISEGIHLHWPGGLLEKPKAKPRALMFKMTNIIPSWMFILIYTYNKTTIKKQTFE